MLLIFRTSSSFEDSSGKELLRKGEKEKKEENREESPREIYFLNSLVSIVMKYVGEDPHEIFW